MKNNILVFMVMLMILVAVPFGSAASSSLSVTDSQMLVISLINTDPDPAEAGDIVEVRLAIENKGGEQMKDVSLEFIESYPFTLLSGENPVQEVGTIMSYQDGDNAKIVKFKVKVDSAVSPDNYDMKVRVYEGNKALFEKIVSIDVDNPSSALLITIDDSDLAPGESGKVTFTVENQGGSELKDLIFKWKNDDKVILPIGSDNIKYIKDLGVGEKAELKFNMIADSNAEPGLYQLDLEVEYQNSVSSDKKTSETVAGFYVGGGTSFDMSFADESNGEYSFNIANIGNNPAYSVVVRVLEENGWQVLGGSSEIVGNLNNGDYTVVSYELSRQAIKQELDSALKLSVEYTDTKGVRLTVIKEIDLESSTQTTAAGQVRSEDMKASATGNRRTGQGGPFGSASSSIGSVITIVKNVLIGIVVLIVAFFGYKMWNNRSRKKLPKKKL